MSDTDWTPEMVEQLAALWATDLTTREIAVRLGLGSDGKNAVVGKAHRLHLPPRANPIKRGVPNARSLRATRAAEAAALPGETGGGMRQPASKAPHTSYAARAAAGRAAKRCAGALTSPGAIRPGFEAPVSKTRTCAFPLWGGSRPTGEYCGKPALLIDGRPSPYCPEHHARCRVPVSRAKAEEAA